MARSNSSAPAPHIRPTLPTGKMPLGQFIGSLGKPDPGAATATQIGATGLRPLGQQ